MSSPDYGRRLLPTLVDEIAATDPERTFVSIPKTLNVQEGFQNVSFSALARAVNRCSRHIEQRLGRAEDYPSIAYMGPQDIRYLILLLACVKTGYKLFVPSPRIGIEAHLALLDALQCHTLFVPEGPQHILEIIRQITSKMQTKCLEVESLSHLLEDGHVPYYRYDKTFDMAKNEPFVVMHTSGSTGPPKLVVVNHRAYTAMDATQNIPSLGGNPTHINCWQGLRSFMPFPLFHSAGLSMLALGIYAGITTVLPPPIPLTAHLADAVHRHSDVQLTILPPSIYAEIVREPDYLEKLNDIAYACYGGGPLPPAVGNKIASKTHLHNGFGSTEAGWYPLDMPDIEDWQYLKFSPFLGYEMRHYDKDLFELCIIRDPKLEDYQAVFSTLPDISSYPTKDLFSKHPNKDGLWLPRGRRDDIIVYSTGEKMNPSSFEGTISGHPEVKGALIYGQGQFQSALLIEARNAPTTEDEKKNLRAKLSSLVREANQRLPAYGRVLKDMILFTTPDKPLPRASKGTIQRRMAYDMYSAELKDLYENQKSLKLASGSTVTSLNSSKMLLDEVLKLVRSAMEVESITAKTNLFDLGLDSLQVLTLTSRLKNCLMQFDIPAENLSSKAIYESRDIETLISKLLNHDDTSNDPALESESVFESYISELPLTARERKRSPSGERVILTGSTGSLGTHILNRLLGDSSVHAVYCLNRSQDGERRQMEALMANGIKHNPEGKSVTFFQIDLSKPYLGLSMTNYMTLLEDVTLIIHNAWTVDFLQSLEHIASIHVRGVKQLVDFSSRSKYGAFLLFISSVGAVKNWDPKPEGACAIPEEIFDNWELAADSGYARAKLISERIIEKANTHASIPAAICRIGQIAGPTTVTGQWPKREWLPSIIASAKLIGKLPSSLVALEMVDWVPVDVVASTVLELAKYSTSNSPHTSLPVYHIVNPRKTSWSALLPTIQRQLALDTVSPSEWLRLLREVSAESSDVVHNPAMKLIDFMGDALSESESEKRHNLPLAVDNTIKVAPSLADLEPIDERLMALWLEQWNF